MGKLKKAYEKPELKAVKMQEVGAILCCRATTGTCSAANRLSRGKGTRARDSS